MNRTNPSAPIPASGRRRRRWLPLALAAVLALSACGQEADSGQFSQWFWTLAADPQQPEASEALLASMGTVIGQSQTVDGVTATLHGALWDGYHLVLSLSLEGEGLDAAAYSNSVTSEASWLAPPRDALETEMRNQLPDLPEADLQTYLDDYCAFRRPRIDYLYNRETGARWLQVSRSASVAAEEDPQELTLHLEDLSFSNTIVGGPFDFTFTAEPKMAAKTYAGDVLVEPEDGPALRITAVAVSPFRAEVLYETVESVPSEETVLERVQIGGLRIGGLETDVSGSRLREAELQADGRVSGRLAVSSFHQVVDPAAVEAVEVCGVWVELSELTPAEP